MFFVMTKFNYTDRLYRSAYF